MLGLGDEATVSIGLLRRLAARRPRHPIVAAMREEGIDLLAPDGPRRIPQVRYVEIMERLPRIVGDPALGIHLARVVIPADLGVVQQLTRSSATLGAAIEQTDTHMARLGGTLRVKMTPRVDGSTVVAYELRPELRVRSVVELTVGLAIRSGRLLGGGGPPAEVHFRHPRPSYARTCERFFETRCVFDSSFDGFVMQPSAEHVPVRGSDAELLAVLEGHARALTSRRDEGTIADRVRHRILRELPAGAPTIETVSRQLGLSERTVRRRLAAEQTTYHALLEELRHGLAKCLLADKLDTAEIAERLGYSTPCVFRRAFTRWAGVSPMRYRNHVTSLPMQPAATSA